MQVYPAFQPRSARSDGEHGQCVRGEVVGYSAWRKCPLVSIPQNPGAEGSPRLDDFRTIFHTVSANQQY